MIAGIDSHGEIYYSLLQANSNAVTIELFMTHLVKILDKQRPQWSKDTIMLLDGAPWHTAKNTIAIFERLNIPVMISGPYSYDGSPIELFFAALKKGNLNPDGLPLSRSKYIF